METITVLACAKLNLYIDVTGKREDGCHEIETVMQSVDLCDMVRIAVKSGEGIRVKCSNPLIPTDEDNTAYCAAELFLEETGKSANIEINIDKRIPAMAGLGGGSADAAAVLKALNRYFKDPLDDEKLMELAKKTGADVPFCLHGGTALCKGTGDEITALSPVKGCGFLVVMPDFSCSTAEAYSSYDKTPVKYNGGLDEFTGALASKEFAGKMYNVFRALYNDGRIEDICERLISSGASGASLTGSGAAVFGVFKDDVSAAKASGKFPAYFSEVCRPSEHGVIFVD